MKRPQIYFVNGTAVADKSEHVFKDVISGYDGDINKLYEIADVTHLVVDEQGLYFLKNEGCGVDCGEKYLVSTGDIVSGGDSDGSIASVASILSPILAYNNYVDNIKIIKHLLNNSLDDTIINRTLHRLLFIGVCGEMEGYLYTTIIALIEGCSDAFDIIKDSDFFISSSSDKNQRRSNIVKTISNNFCFQQIRNRNSRERGIYEELLGEKLIISQELIDFIVWRNKLAHKVPLHHKPIYPSKEDVLDFINETDKLVNYIDNKINKFKSEWLIL